MQPVEVGANNVQSVHEVFLSYFLMMQMVFHMAMPTSVLVLAPFIWMMLLVLQVLVNYWSALVDQSWHITVIIMLMLVSSVMVIYKTYC